MLSSDELRVGGLTDSVHPPLTEQGGHVVEASADVQGHPQSEMLEADTEV